MDNPALLSLAGVGKRFSRRWVLQNISFDVAAGDFILLLGGNGAGKTTLMKLLSALMTPSRGSLSFQGRPLAQSAGALRRAMGVVFHDSHFYGDLNARENLRLFGALYGVDGLDGKIPGVLAEVGLEAFPEVPVRAFSSGMVKRLGFARLRLYRPQLLLLDEPFSGLDQESVALVEGFLRQHRDGGGTTLMVTHQFTEGVGFANRILILNRGALMYNQPVKGATGASCAALLAEFGGAAARG